MFVQHPKDTKKGTFSLQKGKKGTPNLTSSWPLYNVFDKTNLKKKKKKNYQGQCPEVRLSFSLK